MNVTKRPTVARPDGMPSSANERHLRRLLAHWVNIPQAYYDDGEASGAELGIAIDFMRESVADLDAKLRALMVARAERSKTPNVAVERLFWRGALTQVD